MPLIPSSKRNFIGSSLEASSVLRGTRVLARRETDGYYYLGHIVQEVKGSRESFLVEFDQSCVPKGKVQCGWQETPLYDILHYEDARRQPLAPGDRVLAPWEAPAKRFGPGTVLRIVENTEAPLAHSQRGMLVNFWNGQTKEVSSAQALRIPLPLSDRIILELQMPLAARQMVVESSLDYPYLVAPGYRASGHYRQGHLGLDFFPEALYPTHPCAKCSWGCTSLPQCCLGAWESTRSSECQVQQENTFIPGASLTEGKLNKKIEQQLSELRIASSESVPREEEKKEEKRLETENVPEDVRSCLEEDCKVIETEKKLILSGASQKKWKELNFSRAKVEHKRWQEEQRLKREQQQDADGTWHQLRRDSQRQRLHQRTLQGLEKQLERKERALQHVALLQAAGAERSRKEHSFRDEEERKARQRLHFLQTEFAERGVAGRKQQKELQLPLCQLTAPTGRGQQPQESI